MVVEVVANCALLFTPEIDTELSEISTGIVFLINSGRNSTLREESKSQHEVDVISEDNKRSINAPIKSPQSFFSRASRIRALIRPIPK